MYLVAAWSKSPVDRSVWYKPRSHVYWEAAKAGAFGDEWWYENLRMSKATFGILCDELKTSHKQDSAKVSFTCCC